MTGFTILLIQQHADAAVLAEFGERFPVLRATEHLCCSLSCALPAHRTSVSSPVVTGAEPT